MYSHGWGSSAWLKISSGRFVTVAALLCALSTGRAQHNCLAISAFAPLARFLASLNYTPAPERSEGWAVDSLESSWTSITSLGGAGARLVDTHPLASPIKLSMNYLFSLERRLREREMERVHRRTDIANTGGAQNRFIRMYLSDPSHSDPFLVLHSSILQPSSSLVALLAELLKLEPATTTPIYIYIYMCTYISRGWRSGCAGTHTGWPAGRKQ